MLSSSGTTAVPEYRQFLLQMIDNLRQMAAKYGQPITEGLKKCSTIIRKQQKHNIGIVFSSTQSVNIEKIHYSLKFWRELVNPTNNACIRLMGEWGTYKHLQYRREAPV